MRFVNFMSAALKQPTNCKIKMNRNEIFTLYNVKSSEKGNMVIFESSYDIYSHS